MSRNADQSDAPALGQSLPEPLPPDPFPLFHAWLREAEQQRLQPNPNAMALASVDERGRPSCRIVLCKGVDPAAGSITFFTNYAGRKGRELDATRRAAACFHWDAADRQVRIEGVVARAPDAASDAYFSSRPWMSRLGAWASDQSEPIASRAALAAKVEATMRRFGIDPLAPPAADTEVAIPRPPHWGGYTLLAEQVELWVGSSARLHDRARWVRPLIARPGSGSGFIADGPWVGTRLQP
ncbi:MAG: pyridoxamine 5'-phosphate oxidase [Phycisphaeraceae bacterium]|nr:pyridoxamine 5'-phosphate oxidase [Phycisphaeraceae bacterium]